MPAWLVPVLKSVLPYVGTILSAAAPVFTKKTTDAAADLAMLQQQQITELQAAASANDAHIKDLAKQIQNTVVALEKEASLSEQRYQRVMALCIFSVILSAIALSLALFTFLAQ